MEDRLDFFLAVKKIERTLGLSSGPARMMLRELCASDEVRSWREPYSMQGGEPQGEGPLERIEPSLWRQREIDLMTESDGCKYFVSVSETELCHWLKTKQHSKASSPPRKRDLVKQAINELWQNGVPKDLLNKQIETQVRDWITAYCKHEKLPKLEISRETILRAAGRRK